MADNITDIVYYMDGSVDRSVDLDDEAAKRHFKNKNGTLIYAISQTDEAFGTRESLSLYIIEVKDKVLLKAEESRGTYTAFGLDETLFYSYITLNKREYYRLNDLIGKTKNK